MTTVDADFDVVVAARAERESTWITGEVQAVYTDLHSAGVAHSVEVWAGDTLVGGLYGVLTGRVFSGESMFYRISGAAKVAVVDLCDRLVEAGVVLVDTNEPSKHAAPLAPAGSNCSSPNVPAARRSNAGSGKRLLPVRQAAKSCWPPVAPLDERHVPRAQSRRVSTPMLGATEHRPQIMRPSPVTAFILMIQQTWRRER